MLILAYHILTSHATRKILPDIVRLIIVSFQVGNYSKAHQNLEVEHVTKMEVVNVGRTQLLAS